MFITPKPVSILNDTGKLPRGTDLIEFLQVVSKLVEDQLNTDPTLTQTAVADNVVSTMLTSPRTEMSSNLFIALTSDIDASSQCIREYITHLVP